MGTIISVLMFMGVMFLMSKLGLGCCGSNCDHNESNSKKSCYSLEKDKEKIYKDAFIK
ncbi:hypothetical protein [Clostridium sp.]|uniref:hypothetical protein n=1 Tax=Clostridium sp. TaxID=1506 RepID=UPI0026234C02|nr:hypothetical protein [uncultured Clostridium sp.]